MAFDATTHLIKLIIIRCGQELYPDEKNITELYKRTALRIGIAESERSQTGFAAGQPFRDPFPTTSKDINHLPKPQETGPFFKCPKCGEEKLLIQDICPSCRDSEGGKYHTKLSCLSCKFTEKRENRVVTVLTELGYTFKNAKKKELGINTITDDGIK